MNQPSIGANRMERVSVTASACGWAEAEEGPANYSLLVDRGVEAVRYCRPPTGPE